MKKVTLLIFAFCLILVILNNDLLHAKDKQDSLNYQNVSIKKEPINKNTIRRETHSIGSFFRRNEETFITIFGSLIIALLSVFLAQNIIQKRESKKIEEEYYALINNLVFEIFWQTSKIDELQKVVIESQRIFPDHNTVITHLPEASLDYRFLNESRNKLLKFFMGSQEILPFLTFYVNHVQHINKSLNLKFLLEFKDMYDEDEYKETISTIFTNLLNAIKTLNNIVGKLNDSLAKEIDNAPQRCKPKLFSIPKEITDSFK